MTDKPQNKLSECRQAQAKIEKEFPWKGYYGGKVNRIVIEYDDMSSSMIGAPESLKAMENYYNQLANQKDIESVQQEYYKRGWFESKEHYAVQNILNKTDEEIMADALKEYGSQEAVDAEVLKMRKAIEKGINRANSQPPSESLGDEVHTKILQLICSHIQDSNIDMLSINAEDLTNQIMRMIK